MWFRIHGQPSDNHPGKFNTCNFFLFNYLTPEPLIQDSVKSADLNVEFKRYMKEKANPLIRNFDVKVFPSHVWPKTHHFKLILPQELNQVILEFNEFYNTIHNGRKLVWAHQLSNVYLYSNCFKKNYIFQTSVVGGAFLSCFNDQSSYRKSELKELTGLQNDDITQVRLKMFLLVYL